MNDNTIALDIETVANPEALSSLPEPKVDARLKDPEKIAAALAEARKEQVDRMALDPMTGKICSVAFVGLEGGRVAFTSDNESTILNEIFGRLSLAGSNSPTICTWNGIGFDLPFIYKRAMLTKADKRGAPPLSFWMKRYSVTPHADLMQIWCGWYGHVKLDTVAKAVLGRGKEEIDVLTFGELMKNPEGRARIGKYNVADAQLTLELYTAMYKYLF